MPEDSDVRRRDFQRRAPELRAALVEDLSACLDRAATLSCDETGVLRHLLSFAGYSWAGSFFIPVLSSLWGEEASYVPAVALPASRARAAVVTLRRRGILRDAEAGGVILVSDALRALAKPAPAAVRRVVVYIAASLDGYIAKKDGDISFLSSVETPGEDYGYAEFIKGVDAVLMGRKTYDKLLSMSVPFPHSGRKCYVASRKRKGSDGRVEYVRDPAKLIGKLRKAPGKDIFCDGGADLINALLKKDLVDVLVLSVIPVLLGDGIPLFKRGRPEKRLRLVDSRSFPSGVAQLRYSRAQAAGEMQSGWS